MKKIIKNENITINDLAIMVAKGFENVATKDDLKSLATKEELTTKIEGLGKRIDAFAEDKSSKIEHKKLGVRVDFIEKKLEIVK